MGGWASSLCGQLGEPAGGWLTPTVGDTLHLEYGTIVIFVFSLGLNRSNVAKRKFLLDIL